MNEKLTELVAEIFFLDENEVKPELTADDVALWDSLNHLRLITAIEVEFGVKFSMSEIQSIDSISKLNELVEQNA
ncbi:MAG: acyl carrier protein [Gammaproteobacteria bacterium]|jgi:acyl carrier protein|nr:acyl carrier protein [Gammaproteobacteria bacterium]